jgi:hypothetical protein
LSGDSFVWRFRKRKPAPPEDSGVIVMCDEGREFWENYLRNGRAYEARARIAERGRLARVWRREQAFEPHSLLNATARVE